MPEAGFELKILVELEETRGILSKAFFDKKNCAI